MLEAVRAASVFSLACCTKMMLAIVFCHSMPVCLVDDPFLYETDTMSNAPTSGPFFSSSLQLFRLCVRLLLLLL